MAREELFAPLDVELAALFLPFGRLEGQGARCEEEGMRLEKQRRGREEVFAGREVPSQWEEDGGMRLAGLDARRLVPLLFDN
jgi:hypothetical protein